MAQLVWRIRLLRRHTWKCWSLQKQWHSESIIVWMSSTRWRTLLEMDSISGTAWSHLHRHTSPFMATYRFPITKCQCLGLVCAALYIDMWENCCNGNLLISLIMFKMEGEILYLAVEIVSPNLHNLCSIIVAVVIRRFETEMHCVCTVEKE